MKFRPLHDWVVIKRSKAAEMSSGGIIIPDTAKDKPAEGTVEAVGPGRYKQEKGKKEKKDKKFFPTVLKPGQKVMFIDYMAKDVELDGMEITLIREDDVLGTMEQRGELTVKKEYHVEIKKDHPPMVQARPEKEKAAVGVKQSVKIKKEDKGRAAVSTKAKKSTKQKKEGTMKKTAKKTAPAKKTAAKKTLKKTVKKATAKKAAPKKTIKKAVAKKATAKRTKT